MLIRLILLLRNTANLFTYLCRGHDSIDDRLDSFTNTLCDRLQTAGKRIPHGAENFLGAIADRVEDGGQEA